MENVSVVIPTLNAGTLFTELLRRLRSQTHPTCEIVVLDSGSTDGTLAIAGEAGARIFQISRSEFDHGLTRNKGIELTGGNIVILMTQDAVPANEHMIERMVAAFDDPQVAGVFARQIPRSEHDALVRRNIEAATVGGTQRRVSHIIDRTEYDALSAIERYHFCAFDNVCSAVRKSAWQQIPFRQCAFGEDVDWSKRALEAGWKIVFEPTAAVIHSHNRSARYEFDRTYMGHQTLYRLFGLSTIPALKYVPACLLLSMKWDLTYAWRHQAGAWRKLKLMLRVPLLSWGSVWGQYTGARDARLGTGKRIGGV